MAHKPFFDDSHVEPVANLLRKGLSYREIAQQFGCDHHTVAKFVRERLPDWHATRSGQHAKPMPIRLLVIDIETRPNLAYIWDVWSHNPVPPSMLLDEKDIISFAAKWVGEDAVEFRSTHHDGKAKMIERAHALLDEADGVITYNGDNFDLRHLNLEFLRSGMTPPSPYKSVDLLKTIKRKFNFTSRKLEHVASKLEIGHKVEHEGFSLWKKCMDGDEAAWRRMREYNIGDVQLTEQLYHELLPWIEGHPSIAAFMRDDICPNCGSEDLHRKGFYRTKTGTFQRYQCGGCGKWSRDRKGQFHTAITETAMA